MSPEVWTIIGVGIALASLMLAGQRSMRHDIAEVRNDLGRQIADVRDQVAQLRERMAHLEGLLDGLREAIARNRAA